jgi:hypothetical protein
MSLIWWLKGRIVQKNAISLEIGGKKLIKRQITSLRWLGNENS